jgi:hypothetical protein
MTPEQKTTLTALCERLSPGDVATLLRFAEFLANGPGAAVTPPTAFAELPEPEEIPRPDNESVVAAVKRLSRTYFMLDKKAMLNATSELVIQGRDGGEVIDELEALFRQRYQQLKQGEPDL